MAASRARRPPDDLQGAVERMADALLSAEVGAAAGGEGLEGLAARMRSLYAEAFPKACRCCGRVYRTPEEYQRETHRIGREGGAYFDPEDRTVQEFRDCPCGSTLLMLTGDRRDSSPAGEARRHLFDECVERLRRLTGRPTDELQPMVRRAFRSVIGRLSVAEEHLPTRNGAGTAAAALDGTGSPDGPPEGP